ncbi:MAG: Hsp20/alpha crystallin family protein [Acidimicrobiales bacterium]|nr:Hsp20/alpha crystallin family protein [Acidimicrobiales bacterium]
MALLRSDPFRELDRLSQQLWGNQGRPSVMPMPLDAYRQGDRFVVHVDLPGVDPSSIDVSVERDVLTIKAERSWRPDEGVEVSLAERAQGTFSRQLFLGQNLDTGRVQANYDKGVLTLTIPVAEAARPRRIEVSSTEAPKAVTA